MVISEDSIVVAAKSQVSCELDGETVLLHFDKGLYFGLNEVGTLIWRQLQVPRKVREICNSITREYDVPVDECRRDLFALLDELLRKGLIEIRDEAAA